MIAWAREQVGRTPSAGGGAQPRRDPAALPRDERRRARAVRPGARARAVVLHRRDHGDRRAGSGGQPRRRRPLRRTDRHVLAARTIPACGFSLGLERILVVMGERGMFPATLQTRAGRRAGDALRRASRSRRRCGSPRELRAAGLRVEVYPEPDKLGKQFKYAVGARRPVRRRRRRRRARRGRGHDQGPGQRASRRRRRARRAIVGDASVTRDSLNSGSCISR